MEHSATIDAAGRLVIPKPLREKLGLAPGTRLHISEQDGRLVLSPDTPEPRLVERDGFLVIDLGSATAIDVDSRAARDERIRDLVRAALEP